MDALKEGEVSVLLEKGVDVSTPEGLERLPEELGELVLEERCDDDGGGGEEAQRYRMLRERLSVAMEEQRRQRGRLEGYRELEKILGLFMDGVGVEAGGQDGEGELGRELEKMRGLVERVVGRIGEVREGGGERVGGVGIHGADVEMERGEKARLRQVMEVL